VKLKAEHNTQNARGGANAKFVPVTACAGLVAAGLVLAVEMRAYEFVITFAPLPVEGGTGSPVNPLVTF
jgi:hypothetical protein